VLHFLDQQVGLVHGDVIEDLPFHVFGPANLGRHPQTFGSQAGSLAAWLASHS
jgi:hypothetical protein